MLRTAAGASLIVAVAAMLGCGSGSDQPASRPAATSVTETRPSTASAVEAPVVSHRPRIVILGDSLTAGLGLAPDDAYPHLLQAKVDAVGLDYEVVNAGVSGDTSAGGLSRLDLALQGDVKLLMVALGGNDGLRGLPPQELSKNLSTIIEQAQAQHVRVLIAGMEAPPNFGQAYTADFRRVYPDLAKKYHVPLMPFLLQDVAGIDRLNQSDGIHPTAEGAHIVADHVWTAMAPLLTTS